MAFYSNFWLEFSEQLLPIQLIDWISILQFLFHVTHSTGIPPMPISRMALILTIRTQLTISTYFILFHQVLLTHTVYYHISIIFPIIIDILSNFISMGTRASKTSGSNTDNRNIWQNNSINLCINFIWKSERHTKISIFSSK